MKVLISERVQRQLSNLFMPWAFASDVEMTTVSFKAGTSNKDTCQAQNIDEQSAIIEEAIKWV